VKYVDHRIGAAHTAFGKLYKTFFKKKDLSRTTKLMVYQAVVWTPYQKDLKKLEQFHQRKLRSILNMKWDDYTTNDSILEQANAVSIESTGVKHRLCWSGHIAKMSDARLP